MKNFTIILNTRYGVADKMDKMMMDNFIEKVEKAFNEEEILDITFTLYKDLFPLEAVIHFTGDKKYYCRYNLYSKNLEVHNTGYQCNGEILNLSKKYILKDSALKINC